MNRSGKRRLVMGVGINDSDYAVDVKEELPKGPCGQRRRRLVFLCPFYDTWKKMLYRCYDKTYTDDKIKSYKGATVCEEWLTFSNFRRWMSSQDWQGKQLDKDLLVTGNRVYSPETCLMLDPKINLFLIDGGRAKRGEFPLGVNKCSRDGIIYASIKNTLTGKREYLGAFKCSLEAHLAWKSKKHEIACKLAKQQSDPRVADALCKRYAPNTDWSKV